MGFPTSGARDGLTATDADVESAGSDRKRLRVLILEDRPSDARLMVEELKRHGFEVEWHRADAEVGFVAGLEPAPDVILADYTVPGFGAPRALQILRSLGLDIPLIVVTGSISEEVAAECIKAGAADYLLKDRLTRLGPAVAQALEQARLRSQSAAALHALKQEKERFQMLVESAPYGTVLVGTDGCFEYTNRKFTKLFGYELADVPTQSAWREWAYPDPVYRERVARTWDSDRGADTPPVTARTFRVRCKDGRDRTVVFHSSELTSGKYIMTLQDITEQKSLEEQLLQAQKMEAVGRLAGGVAHDFNNMLQALLSQAQLVRMRGGDPTQIVEAVGEMEEQIRRGAALTRQLLLFSRREAPRRERLDLNDVVEGAVRMLRRLVRETVAFRLELGAERLPVEADRGQLDQVLVNLVVNASDAMPEGGHLTVRTRRAGPQSAWLEVADTGHGIPEAIRDHIFEPFFTTKEAGKGTGLGLSVVHGIIEQHGGRVFVDSRVGEGTRFSISLPMAGSGEDPAVDTTDGPSIPRGRGERVLVVEDQSAAREALRDLLASLGYEVTAVGSGEEAGGLPVEPAIDVLLTDLGLPGVSGTELAGGLRDRWPGLKVILMSGYTEDEAVRQGIHRGDLRFLQKPFEVAVLARELHSALHPS